MCEHGTLGIFDSGMGGLTVFREIATLRPELDLLYLGDTARVPYGVRSPDVIRRYVHANVSYLMTHGISALVVACNTATAVALEDLKRDLPIPVFGVIEPSARRAACLAPTGTIAVLATETTVRSGAYARAIRHFAKDAVVIECACPLFVPLAEEGWTDNEVAKRTIEIYLEGFCERGVNVVILGCTHYPLFAGAIKQFLGNKVLIVDSARSTADEVIHSIPLTQGKGSHRFLVTDMPERFARVGAAFFGGLVKNLARVDIPIV